MTPSISTQGRRFLSPALGCFIVFAALLANSAGQATGVEAVSAGDAELQKCETQIASVQREVIGRYETMLGELQEGFQKSADLEGAVAVRDERQRVAKESALSEQNLVTEPRTLRASWMRRSPSARQSSASRTRTCRWCAPNRARSSLLSRCFRSTLQIAPGPIRCIRASGSPFAAF